MVPPHHSTKYHLYIPNKRLMPIITAVKSNLIRINNSIIILPRNHPPYPLSTDSPKHPATYSEIISSPNRYFKVAGPVIPGSN